MLEDTDKQVILFLNCLAHIWRDFVEQPLIWLLFILSSDVVGFMKADRIIMAVRVSVILLFSIYISSTLTKNGIVHAIAFNIGSFNE